MDEQRTPPNYGYKCYNQTKGYICTQLTFYDNDLFNTRSLSPPSDETIFIFRNLHSALVFLAFQVQMECLEYPGLPDRKDPREGKV